MSNGELNVQLLITENAPERIKAIEKEIHGLVDRVRELNLERAFLQTHLLIQEGNSKREEPDNVGRRDDTRKAG